MTSLSEVRLSRRQLLGLGGAVVGTEILRRLDVFSSRPEIVEVFDLEPNPLLMREPWPRTSASTIHPDQNSIILTDERLGVLTKILKRDIEPAGTVSRVAWKSDIPGTPVAQDQRSVWAVGRDERIYKVDKRTGKAAFFAPTPEGFGNRLFSPFFVFGDVLATNEALGGFKMYNKNTGEEIELTSPQPRSGWVEIPMGTSIVGGGAVLTTVEQPTYYSTASLRWATWRWHFLTEEGKHDYDEYGPPYGTPEDNLIEAGSILSAGQSQLRENDTRTYLSLSNFGRFGYISPYDYMDGLRVKPLHVAQNYVVADQLTEGRTKLVPLYYIFRFEDITTTDDYRDMEYLKLVWGPMNLRNNRQDVVGSEGNWIFFFDPVEGILSAFNGNNIETPSSWDRRDVDARQYLGKVGRGRQEILVFGNLYQPYAEVVFDPTVPHLEDLLLRRDSVSAQWFRAETPQPVRNPEVYGIRPNGELAWRRPLPWRGRVRAALNGNTVVAASSGGIRSIDARNGQYSDAILSYSLGEPLHMGKWGNLVTLESENGLLTVIKP